MFKQRKLILFCLISITLFLGLFHVASAQIDPFGGRQIDLENQLGLGREDPRIIAANVIRIALGFLGIIAVALIIYAGWLWMSAAGAPDKIERAKKILIGAVIGLLIILSSFALATFILNRLLEATGVGGPGGPGGPGSCIEGATRGCGCGGTETCSGGSWGACIGSTCPPGGTPCDGDGLTAGCQEDDTLCTVPGEFCDALSGCICKPAGSVGDPCSATTTPSVCEPEDIRCAALLKCNPTSCVCEGAPVIDWLSPVDAGGTPNGAAGNFITIGGRYFGTTTGQVYFADATGSTTVLAGFPGAPCIANWTENQIIVIVPAGAADGPLRVVRADSQEDTTDNARGNLIDDFEVNTVVRPGLCLATPASGYLGDSFTLNGANFNGATRRVLFGNETASTTSSTISPWTPTSIDASVPNLRPGGSTVFVNADGRSSNVLNFTVLFDAASNPVIDYIDPELGPVGQYITIYGRNFKPFQSGASRVEFGNGGPLIDADIDFPAACQGRWWQDSFIIVKVPSGAVPAGPWQITVTNRDGQVSAPADFSVTVGAPGPGLCALIPHNGLAGQAVEAHGDGFGAIQGTGRAEFFNTMPGLVSSWASRRVDSNVPAGAETGPFRVINNAGDVSNSLAFQVGKCASTATDCLGGEECCAGGSWDGVCRPSGTCGEGGAPSCTFGWSFTTAVGTTTPLTCSGFSSAAACVDAGSCPNSPGECQSASSTSAGPCGDTFCNARYAACGGSCVYDGAINKCKVSASTCDNTDTGLIAGYTAQCRQVSGSGRWQINTGGASCPGGSFRDLNGWCTVGAPGSPLACDLCASGLVCQAGECVVNQGVCPTGSSCIADQCITGGSICECCCRVANSAQDCCAGLTCQAGGCGNDPVNYGLCTGCRVELNGNPADVTAAEQAASDEACNCTAGQASRFCNLTDLATYPTGFCDDGGGAGDPCDFDTDTPACDPNDGMCLPGYTCRTSDCTCQWQSLLGGPCDSDLTNAPICDPDDTLCAVGTCNTATCICEAAVATSTPGVLCQNALIPACTTGVASCGSADYSCLNEPSVDCRCCCVPGTTNAAGLVCVADQSPCSGGSRGLYCGCESDSQCGAPGSAACGLDACCHSRPSIVSVEPPEGATDVCRNPLVKVTFSEEMDTGSFVGNIVVLGEYGSDPCPAGTTYILGANSTPPSRLSWLWQKIRSWFAGPARAQVHAGNYCAVSGLSGGYNNSSRQGILTFAPSRVLDASRTYWVIVRGDDLATATSSEGVLSRFGVGLATTTSESFNGQFFRGKIWSFTTRASSAGSDGICRLEQVVIDPGSYTFNSIAPDPADDGLSNPLDSSTFDNDKIFVAYARSGAATDIVPVAGYRWEWSWKSENPAVASVSTTTAAAITPARAVLRAENQKDAKTYLDAEARITEDLINSPGTLGRGKTNKASIHVFLCENPWPPLIDPVNWPWQDSATNCTTPLGAACIDNNFELYYCRDSGDRGTANDLPAILVNPVVRGTSSLPSQPLKELFFPRENLPDATAALTVTDQTFGGSVYAAWPAVAGASSYKLYYGPSSGNYPASIETTALNQIVSGLTNNRRYYFVVTSIASSSRAESGYSNEVVVTPTDQSPPPLPTGFIASSTADGVDLSWVINTSSDLSGYRLYYGTTAGAYGGQEDAGRTSGLNLRGLESGVTYYFMLAAYDRYNNEATTSPISATPD